MSDTPRTDLIRKMRRQAKCIYLSVQEDIAIDISDSLTQAADDIEQLERELAEARRGAERWRYWRKHHGWTGYFDDGLTNSEEPDDIDAAIDAAMKDGSK